MKGSGFGSLRFRGFRNIEKQDPRAKETQTRYAKLSTVQGPEFRVRVQGFGI